MYVYKSNEKKRKFQSFFGNMFSFFDLVYGKNMF